MGASPDISNLNGAGAIRRALADAMADDEDVVVLGEAVGRLGGIHRTTQGLLAQFGADRVIDTPLSEAGAVGLAVGMAMGGKRPVVTLSDADRAWAAAEQLVRELGRVKGEFAAPVVLRLPVSGAGSDVEGMLTASGLTVAAPATPNDAAGLLRGALRGRGPVALLEPIALYSERGPCPSLGDGEAVPFGQPRVARSGEHLTILTWGAGVAAAEAGADMAAEEGLSAEVIDLRTLSPLNLKALAAAVRRTGRALVVGDGPFAENLLAAVTRAAFLHLESPPAASAANPERIAAAIAESVWY